MARLAILCPGQGAQSAQMFADLARFWQMNAAQVQAIDYAWQSGTGTEQPGLEQVLQDPQHLFANRHAQCLLVLAAQVQWRQLQSVWGDLPSPSLVAGYSVGELSAALVAGALPESQLLPCARQRALAMDGCRGAQQHSMLALQLPPGLDVDAWRTQMGTQQELFIAIDNGPRNVLVAGHTAVLNRWQSVFQEQGFGVQALPVEVASHTPLMAAAQPLWGEFLQKCAWQTPQIPVLAAGSASLCRQSAEIVANLLQQLTHPVRWGACMQTLLEQGITHTLELAPGAGLTRMLHTTLPQIESRAVSQFRSSKGLQDWLCRQLAD